MTPPSGAYPQHLGILATGALSTVQDLGRPGYAHLGVPLSGAADRGAQRLANRLVGNPEGAATIEVTLGGLSVTVAGDLLMVVTGAPCAVVIDGRPTGPGAAFVVRDGQTVSLGTPPSQLRSYLAVRGGIDVPAVLGSRSTDTLSDLGPAPLRVGDRVAVGSDRGAWPSTTEAPGTMTSATDEIVALHAEPGPRAQALIDPQVLYVGLWMVNPSSNRVGVRLDRDDPGSPLPETRSDGGTLASEGVALGSVQIPPSGQPVVFLADHPVTGGYPVAAVLTADSVDRAAQLVPGQRVRLHR
ncbi:biotin-dependent carboxyltransferase family protein [Williamsia sp.]|uniref:5-oxoprolinase subunit C family protein n=1 Tax=Williamsia sp. TaxID=1872085 RepID=UPI001A33ABEE|nr:biotin-dependent carboxyltransferase family protein [Williamsia sp.]MBJ7288039.1 biotin-dependent carboxyltransferase family protein [Williamsia sp.]